MEVGTVVMMLFGMEEMAEKRCVKRIQEASSQYPNTPIAPWSVGRPAAEVEVGWCEGGSWCCGQPKLDCFEG